MKKLQLIALAMLALAVTGCGFRGDPGESEKIGTIVRVGKIGLINQTWEAQIIRGGLNAGSGSFGQAFNFTIEDAANAALVKKYMDEGREVKIRYRCEAIYSSFRTESVGDFLISIEPLSTK